MYARREYRSALKLTATIFHRIWLSRRELERPLTVTAIKTWLSSK
jgi:hypothetical protein